MGCQIISETAKMHHWSSRVISIINAPMDFQLRLLIILAKYLPESNCKGNICKCNKLWTFKKLEFAADVNISITIYNVTKSIQCLYKRYQCLI